MTLLYTLLLYTLLLYTLLLYTLLQNDESLLEKLLHFRVCPATATNDLIAQGDHLKLTALGGRAASESY
jgi:hypothetical protein